MSDGHYFDDDPDTPSSPHPVTVTLPDMTLTLTADRGVFSAGRLDAGTKLLLLEAPALDDARSILDIGCGWGPITCVAGHRAPRATVWGIDVNRRARALTAANADATGLGDRVHVGVPDEVPSDLAFDRILSNPPIRVGKKALHQLLLRWLPRLTPDGAAHLVVQKHLGSDSLANWLGEQGFPTSRLSSRAGYRILEVRRGDNESGKTA
ncbi:MAG: methyltransferase [Acidimicrobiales bacterium]